MHHQQLKPLELQAVIGNYLFSEREPLRDDIVNGMKQKPLIRERKTKVERVLERIVSYVDTFIEGWGRE